MTAVAKPTHDGFISYSHAAYVLVAARHQQAEHTSAKSW
jgi:hypothetical protein